MIQYFVTNMLSDQILDLRKCPNRKTHESESACFPVGALPNESIFLIKYYIITVIKKNGAFWPIFNKVKKWISHCIFKSFAEGVKGFFSSQGANFFAKLLCLYLPTKQPWGSPMFGFCHHHLQLQFRWNIHLKS